MCQAADADNMNHRKVGDLPILTIQDPSDVQGAIMYDCRPPLLPVSLQLEDMGRCFCGEQ